MAAQAIAASQLAADGLSRQYCGLLPNGFDPAAPASYVLPPQMIAESWLLIAFAVAVGFWFARRLHDRNQVAPSSWRLDLFLVPEDRNIKNRSSCK